VGRVQGWDCTLPTQSPRSCCEPRCQPGDSGLSGTVYAAPTGAVFPVALTTSFPRRATHNSAGRWRLPKHAARTCSASEIPRTPHSHCFMVGYRIDECWTITCHRRTRRGMAPRVSSTDVLELCGALAPLATTQCQGRGPRHHLSAGASGVGELQQAVRVGVKRAANIGQRRFQAFGTQTVPKDSNRQ
jgi:hypothetical protein